MDASVNPPSSDSADKLRAYLRGLGSVQKDGCEVVDCFCERKGTLAVNPVTREFKCSCGETGTVSDVASNAGKASNGAHAEAEKEPLEPLDVALRLAAAGLPIIPVSVFWNQAKQKWDKVPCIDDWPNEASTHPNKIRKWWKEHPRAQPGIALERTDLAVIDADRHRFDEDGVAALKALEAKYKELKPHPICLTAGDGEHHIFRQPPGDKLGNSRGNLPPGIDVRGVGGFIMAPGARRPDGKLWRAPGFLKAYRAGEIPIIPD
jgi:Bifunctional DNA primase/polymerase, N-terminal